MHPNFLSINLTAKAYGVSRRFLYNLREKGKLHFYQINQKTFIKISEFEALMKPWEKPVGKEVAHA